MKLFSKVLFVVVLAPTAWAAKARFSAYSEMDRLFVTLNPLCNTFSVSLVVDPSCHSQRPTKNGALLCSGKLAVVDQTGKECLNQVYNPVVYEISLDGSFVAPEAVTLDIEYDGAIETVDLSDR